jgi:hypothetical protein
MTDFPESDRKLTRSELIRNAIHNEYLGGGTWREVVSPDANERFHGRCYVTRIWGKEPKSS